MTLPSSGAITFANVNTELGFNATTIIALNDSPVRSLFGKPSGAISMSDGYGKSNITYVTFTSSTTWVVPAGVTNIKTMSGRGGSGVSDYNSSGGVYWQVESNSSMYFENDAYLNASVPFNAWNNYTSYVNNNVGNIINLEQPGNRWQVGPNNKWREWGYGSSMVQVDYRYVRQAPFYSSFGTVTALTSSQPVTYAYLNGGSYTFYTAVYYKEYGRAGDAAIISGSNVYREFPGGSYTGTYPNAVGGNATTTFFSNVVVTPGSTLQVGVPSGGVITIGY